MAAQGHGVEPRGGGAPGGSSTGGEDRDRSSGHAVLEQQFWRYSVECYARPHVQTLSLDLQDRHRFDVNIMLFCLWLAETQRAALNRDGIEALRRAAAPINDNLVAPIRSARRWLKGWMDGGTDKSDRAHYDALKAVELRCEQLVQRALIEQLVQDLPQIQVEDAQRAATSSLQAYAELLSADREAVSELRELVARAVDQDAGSAGSCLGG